MTLDLALSQTRRRMKPTTLLKYVSYVAIGISLAFLFLIVGFVMIKGVPYLSFNFIFGKNSYISGVTIAGPIVTTLKLILVTVLISTPIGVATAIYLVEYTHRGNKLVKIIKVATETLAGVPSIIFGLFGVMLFVANFGLGIWAGALTLSLMILPTIISTVEESLRGVPDLFREASLGLGATKLRTVFTVVIPCALSGILSAVILSIGRIVSESACVLFTAGNSFDMGKKFGSEGATLAVTMYLLAGEGKYENQAYATGVVLIILVVGLNLLATFVAKKLKKI